MIYAVPVLIGQVEVGAGGSGDETGRPHHTPISMKMKIYTKIKFFIIAR